MSMYAGAVDPDIHDQGAELDLLDALASRLPDRSAIDVGAERGATAAALRASGYGPIWLIEPFPGHAATLRARFAGDPEVRVLEIGAGRRDGSAELHLAEDVSGNSLDAFHSLVPRPARPNLHWNDSLPVRVRSLGSLCAAGEIPSRLGLLKVDAEGFDAEVLGGATGIRCEVVMVEFWRDLPGTVGPCPYSLEELRALVEPIGPCRFLFVRHGPRGVSVGRWDTAGVIEGEWGNLIFVTGELVDAAEAVLPAIERALADRNQPATAEQESAVASRGSLVTPLHGIAEGIAARGRDSRARVAARIHRLRTPALGRFRLHPPEPLTIPRSYLRLRTPGTAPRISIVTPSYQQGGYLERTIRSVVTQDYPELEYIVRDRGSSDDTCEVLERHSDSLASWASEPDDGRANAINCGFERSTGDVMCYLNSGDLLLPGALAYVARYFKRHPRVDVIYGHRIIVDEDEREVGRWLLPRHADYALALVDYVPQETLFWRRRAWERAGGGLDTGLDFALDWDLLLRFMRTGSRMVRVPRFLAAFRAHGGQEPPGQGAREEIRRVRENWHGRHLSTAEITASLGPFHRRHKLRHWEHRLRRMITPKVRLESAIVERSRTRT